MNKVFLFPQKTQQNLQTTKSIQDIFFFEIFQARKRKAENSVLPAFVFKILCHFCPLLRILIFTIFAAFSAFH